MPRAHVRPAKPNNTQESEERLGHRRLCPAVVETGRRLGCRRHVSFDVGGIAFAQSIPRADHFQLERDQARRRDAFKQEARASKRATDESACQLRTNKQAPNESSHTSPHTSNLGDRQALSVRLAVCAETKQAGGACCTHLREESKANHALSHHQSNKQQAWLGAAADLPGLIPHRSPLLPCAQAHVAPLRNTTTTTNKQTSASLTSCRKSAFVHEHTHTHPHPPTHMSNKSTSLDTHERG